MSSKKAWAIPPDGRKFQADFMSAERQYNIPHNLLARMAYQESRFREDVISGTVESSAGAQGLMQIIPKWHPEVNPLDPYDAINYAGYYLRKMYDQFGSWDRALAAYNWGPGNVKKAIVTYEGGWLNFTPKETQEYVAEITEDIILV